MRERQELDPEIERIFMKFHHYSGIAPKIILTSQMKAYLRQEMVLSDFELKKLLEVERGKLLQSIQQVQDRIKAIDSELAEIQEKYD